MKKPSGNGTHGNRHRGLGERVEHIGSSAQELLAEARDTVSDLKKTLDLRARMERHPYAMLATAAVVGYVLGGGLFTATTARLVRLGLKVAALPLIKNELFNLAESSLSGFGAPSGSEASRPTESPSATAGSSGV
jgi:hypothetical protein